MITIAESVKEEMIKRGEDTVWKGDHSLLLDAYHSVAGRKVRHPLNVADAVINAVRRSTLFRHDGYIRSHSDNNRQVRFACFVLRENKD